MFFYYTLPFPIAATAFAKISLVSPTSNASLLEDPSEACWQLYIYSCKTKGLSWARTAWMRSVAVSPHNLSQYLQLGGSCTALYLSMSAP